MQSLTMLSRYMHLDLKQVKRRNSYLSSIFSKLESLTQWTASFDHPSLYQPGSFNLKQEKKKFKVSGHRNGRCCDLVAPGKRFQSDGSRRKWKKSFKKTFPIFFSIARNAVFGSCLILTFHISWVLKTSLEWDQLSQPLQLPTPNKSICGSKKGYLGDPCVKKSSYYLLDFML